MKVLFLILAFVMSATAQTAADINEISLTDDGGFGFERDTKIVFFSDGSAAYFGGRNHFGLKGKYVGRVEKSEFMKLAKLIVAEKFFSFKERFDTQADDAATMTTTVVYKDGRKEVVNFSNTGDEKLRKIQRAINALGAKLKWEKEEKSTRRNYEINKTNSIFLMIIACLAFSVLSANAQLGGTLNKVKIKTKDTKTKDQNKTQTNTNDEESEKRAENARNLAKSAGMPKAANTDTGLNKLLFQAADDTRLIPRRVVVVDADWLVTTGAHNAKVRRIFAVIGRTLDDGSGKCGKQMVQFDQDWKADKNDWGLIYVQDIGEVTPIACSAIGK